MIDDFLKLEKPAEKNKKFWDEFFRKRDEISIIKERGDRLRISETDGLPVNIEKHNNFYKINGTTYKVKPYI